MPRVLQRLGYRIAWKDLGRIFGVADAVTAPTPRAVELLQRSAGLTEAFPVSCGIDADRYRRDPSPTPRTCCSWAAWTRRSGSTS